MNKNYTQLKFSGYLSGGVWFPDEYIKDNELARGRGNIAHIRSNPDYVSPPLQYLQFPRWKEDTDNRRITTLWGID